MNPAKSSHIRLVVSGDTLERYNYRTPYFYNWIDLRKKNRTPKGVSSEDSKRKDNVQRAKANIRRIIQCNQEDQEEKPKFITLTYATDIKELDIANSDFSTYQQLMGYRHGDLKYIAVPEFQPVSQRVHYHALYFNLPFVSDFKKEMAHVWPHGSTKIEAIRSINAMPRYIGKYMTKSLGDKRTAGRKSFFTSRNLLRPITIYEENKANQLIQQWEPTMNQVAQKEFVDFRGRDVKYSLYKGAKALTEQLRLLELF